MKSAKQTEQGRGLVDRKLVEDPPVILFNLDVEFRCVLSLFMLFFLYIDITIG